MQWADVYLANATSINDCVLNFKVTYLHHIFPHCWPLQQYVIVAHRHCTNSQDKSLECSPPLPVAPCWLPEAKVPPLKQQWSYCMPMYSIQYNIYLFKSIIQWLIFHSYLFEMLPEMLLCAQHCHDRKESISHHFSKLSKQLLRVILFFYYYYFYCNRHI